MEQTRRDSLMTVRQKARQETRLLSRARLPLGDGRGDPPPAIGSLAKRFPPYNKQSDAEGFRFMSAFRRAGNVDDGNSGKSRAAPGRGSFYP